MLSSIREWITVRLKNSNGACKSEFVSSVTRLIPFLFLLKAIEKEIKKITADFEKISVREESGSKIISEIKNREIPITLDPTLLLTKSEWAEKFNLKENSKKYLLAYFLGYNKNHWKRTESLAQKLNLEIVIIPVFEKDLKRNGVVLGLGPEEFLDLSYNASYVCTDSFHGVAFSVNFGKSFTCFERFKSNDKENQNTRIYNILEKLDLKERLDCFDVSRKINENSVGEKLKTLRNFSEKFLLTSLEKVDDVPEKKHIFEINSLCTGCGACKESCPKGAVEIKKNDNGFYTASVVEGICVSCGICKSVCPMQTNENLKEIAKGKLYSYKDSDSEALLASSSGAVAYRLAKHLSKKGFCVVGCIFDVEEQNAKHVIALPDDAETLRKFRGSKYMQSDFACITSDLLSCETPLAVFGTPCQIAGARNLLKDKKDVIFIDLICHGVPSYNLFEKYKITLKEKYGFGCDKFDITFRYKPNGWRERYMKVSSDGKELLQHKKENEYFMMFESKNCYSEACYECRWRSCSSADLRIGDYWGEKFVDDETGVSMVLSMNETGESVLKEIQSYGRINEEELSDYFVSQQTENVSRTVYYNDVMEMLRDEETSLEEIVEKYIIPFEKRKQVKNKIHEMLKKIIR